MHSVGECDSRSSSPSRRSPLSPRARPPPLPGRRPAAVPAARLLHPRRRRPARRALQHFDRFAAHYRDEPGEGRLDQIYAFPTLAYLAFPFAGAGFFVKPFVSAGLPLLGARTADVGAHTFHQLRVFPLATVILGWEF